MYKSKHSNNTFKRFKCLNQIVDNSNLLTVLQGSSIIIKEISGKKSLLIKKKKT